MELIIGVPKGAVMALSAESQGKEVLAQPHGAEVLLETGWQLGLRLGTPLHFLHLQLLVELELLHVLHLLCRLRCSKNLNLPLIHSSRS